MFSYLTLSTDNNNGNLWILLSLIPTFFIYIFLKLTKSSIHLILFLYSVVNQEDQGRCFEIKIIVQKSKFKDEFITSQTTLIIIFCKSLSQMFVRRLIKNIKIIRPNQFKFTLNKEKGKQDNQQSYYTLLGIPTNATAEQIKSSYQNLVKNQQQDAQQTNLEVLKQIRQAYTVLSNPSERQRYDSQRGYTKYTTESKNIFFTKRTLDFIGICCIMGLIRYYYYPRIKQAFSESSTKVNEKTKVNQDVTTSQQERKNELDDKAQKSVLGGDRDQKLR